MQDDEKRLTHKRYAFCLAYVNNNYNGTQAAITAGYSDKSAQEESSRLLSFVIIKETIAKLEEDRLGAIKVTGESILKRLDGIADKATADGDLGVAARALEILGRGKLWDKGGGGVKSISSNPDGTMKINFGEDDTDNPADK